MKKHTVRRALFATALAATSIGTVGAVALDAGVAQAQTRPTYQLTPRERHNACGNFIGTIIFSDNTSLDCSTGVATL
jgi:hypothetical protein